MQRKEWAVSVHARVVSVQFQHRKKNENNLILWNSYMIFIKLSKAASIDCTPQVPAVDECRNIIMHT